MSGNKNMWTRFDESSSRRHLDKRDKTILRTLAKDARTPFSSISSDVKLTREAVAYRVSQYLKKGIIQQLSTVLDYYTFGLRQYRILILLDEEHQDKHEAFFSWLANHPNTISVLEYTDRWDVCWTLLAADLQELDQAVHDLWAAFDMVITETSKYAVIDTYSHRVLPEQEPRPEVKPYEEHKLDRKLIGELGKNARATIHELAKTLSASPQTIRTRIKELTASNVMWPTAVIDLHALGFQWYTFTVELTALTEKNEMRVREFSRKAEKVILAEKMFGRFDVMLQIIASSPKNYHRTIHELKKIFGPIVRSYDVWLAYKEWYYNPVPPRFLEGSKEKP